jgi:hypothetical protein
LDLTKDLAALLLKATTEKLLDHMGTLLVNRQLKHFAVEAVFENLFLLRNAQGVDDGLNRVCAALVSTYKYEVLLY